MPNANNIARNWLSSEDISNGRISKFGHASLPALEPEFPEAAALLKEKLARFDTERGEEDSSSNQQVTSVADADDFVRKFKEYIRDEAEPAIRWKSKGRTGGAYLHFFPHGKEEFAQADKKDMSLLTERVRAAAVQHAALLPAEVSERLQEFAADWTRLYATQEGDKSDSTGERLQRSAARSGLERALLTAMHTVMAKYPGEVEAFKRYFKLQLLDAPRHASLERSDAPAGA